VGRWKGRDVEKNSRASFIHATPWHDQCLEQVVSGLAN
jgi:hypothetical protein